MSTGLELESMVTRTRGGEFLVLARLGAPVAFAHLFQVGLQVVDTIMAGQYSAVDLAGISLALGLIMPLMILVIGTLGASTPMVAQLAGGGRETDVGVVVRQGILLALAMVMCIIAAVSNAAPLLGWFSPPAEVATVSVGYLHAVLFGYPAWACFLVLRMSCEGLGFTKPGLYISVMALAANIPLNYAFIFGRFGAPEMGGAGCGVATALVMWLQLAAMLLYYGRRRFARYLVFRGSWRPRREKLSEFVRVGLPIGLKIFGPVGVFSLAPLLLARFGEYPVAAGSIGGNVTTLAFMVPIGFATAATIRIGNAVGRRDHACAREIGRTAVVSSVAISGLVALAIAVFNDAVAGLYTDDPALQSMVAALLLIVAVYFMMDATQEPAVGALRGYKDTAPAMWYSIASYWAVALPLGTLLAYGHLTAAPLTVFGYWIAFVVAEGAVAALANWRLRRVVGSSTTLGG